MSVLLVALAVLALAIVVIAIVFLRGKSIKRDSILLVGLSNGGKTQLFSLLTTGKLASNTFTSLKPNEGAINFPDKEQPVPLVDVPGHHRLQRVNLEQYAPQAMAVVVVVDAASFSKTKREVAEFMYDVLTTFEKSQIPLLVVCNKQDNLLAQRCAVIESDIESEVSDLRHTRSADVESLANATVSYNSFLGHQDEDFKLEHIQNQVDFIAASIKQQTDEAQQQVMAWLSKHV
eukprot:m.271580 g.271580  ORF g.271580 m.271580 type:complete len:233 (-) comp15683_c8_seq1:315-1013(-)